MRADERLTQAAASAHSLPWTVSTHPKGVEADPLRRGPARPSDCRAIAHGLLRIVRSCAFGSGLSHAMNGGPSDSRTVRTARMISELVRDQELCLPSK